MNEQDKAELYKELVGRCELFKVVSTIDTGAFVNCGLSVDLFVPHNEQLKTMKVGELHLIYVYKVEKTRRVAGSSKLNKYVYEDAADNVKEGDCVDLFIFTQTALGYKAVVNGDCWGILYKNEVFQELYSGQKIKGYIKKIRPDKRIDLCLEKIGFQSPSDLSERILKYIKAAKGSCLLSDKTPAAEIYRLFGVSKNKFKMAIGHLYKKRLLSIEQGAIKLIKSSKIEEK